MRFLFYDRVIEAVPGSHMTAIKCVSLSEEFLPSHFSRRAVLPGSILVEAMAQVAGWLVNLTDDFQSSAIMTIVRKANITCSVVPGDRLEIHARLLEIESRVAWATCQTLREGEVVGSIDRILFSLFPIETEDEVESERKRFAYFSGNYVVPPTPVTPQLDRATQ
jgi:3-hydroxyacyl-[acyl-carrier-protein] dehydratase